MVYSESDSRLLLIDDRDASVQYEGNWEQQWSGDVTVSSSQSDDASVSLVFDGTRIIVNALRGPQKKCTSNPTMQFSIDGVPSEPYTSEPTANWTLYDVYDKQGLDDDTHTINITVAMPPGACSFYLNEFWFQPSTKYSSLAPLPDKPETGERTTPVGAIVGGVLGAVAILALVLALGWFLWWRRRRHHVYRSLDGPSEPKDSEMVTPFISVHLPSGIRAAVATDSKRASGEAPGPALPSASSIASLPIRSSSPSPVPSTHSTDAQRGGQISSVLGDAGSSIGEAPHLHSPHGNSQQVDPAPLRSGKVKDMVQAAIRAARRSISVRDSTPTEAPPQYSE
ncbi:hypothetical protein BN946_scf184970.g139 [Trametes cinnabarina]|uniref:Uncharacterized protein n=1 Tax=Pycnoporus cinnabarinus TaxID=5643 RepID=A0A060SCV7_PYCCI|nr:hypothetical protein BN946_scf184970.g139 [Trametes cinnabarina]